MKSPWAARSDEVRRELRVVLGGLDRRQADRRPRAAGGAPT